MTVWRCRWCGRRTHGMFGWFHKPAKCEESMLLWLLSWTHRRRSDD